MHMNQYTTVVLNSCTAPHCSIITTVKVCWQRDVCASWTLLLCPLDDYPDGTWLGDENNPEMRVRSPVSAADMLHISTNCRTPEKMALTLLDYLFHREIQAMSNLSGQGKHGKKQLDPLMIYGIRCKCWHHNHLLLTGICSHLLYLVDRLLTEWMWTLFHNKPG